KDIGNAFNMYAVEHKQAWPVVQHQDTSAGGTAPPLLPVPTGATTGERHWTDLISRYATGTKTDMVNCLDIAKLRGHSVIWGCPEWAKTDTFDPTPGLANPDNYNTGYGMNYIANIRDYFATGLTGTTATNSRQNSMAWISVRSSGVFGVYHKAGTPQGWGKRSGAH